MTALLYTSRFEVAPGALARYDEWFARHALDLIDVGFGRVHGYRSSVAARALSNLYELPGLHVFGEQYRLARERDELGRAVRPLLTPAELGVFAPVASSARFGVTGGAGLGAPGVCIVDVLDEHAAGGDTTDVRDWVAATALTMLAGADRVATLYQAVDAPVAPAEPGRLRVVICCPTPDDAFTLSDAAAGVFGARFGAPARLAVDVLMHRVTYPMPADA